MKKLSLLLALLMMLTCVFGSLAEVTDARTEEAADLIVIVEDEPEAPADEEDSSGDSAGDSAGFPVSSGEPEIEYAFSYDVKPLSGAVVHFHTVAQTAYLADPYTDGVINTPSIIEIEGVDYKIDGNPWTSSDLETRERTHEDYSKPNPVVLSWEGEASDTYYVELATDESFEELVRVWITDETSVEIYNLFIRTKYYWRVAPTQADIADAKPYNFTTSSAGPRNIYIDGVTNVRDLGGYVLADGSGEIRQGLIYRGGRLNLTNNDDDKPLFQADPDYFLLTITEKGLDTMVNELHIKTELDVRVPGEVNETGNMTADKIPELIYVNIPMEYQGGERTDNNMTRLDNPARLKEIFELFADEDNYPIYFHCNIGTDRTGCIGYLLGAYLGMSEEDLYINYVFSNFGSISGGAMGAGRSSSSITGSTGYGATVKSYPGDTLSEQAANALMDICGISQETLEKIREILVETY